MNKDIMKAAGFHEEIELCESRRCPCCKQFVTKFRDPLSKKEFEISGLCQKCQDKIFGTK